MLLVLVYIALNLLSPGEIVPALAPFRPMLILALLSLPVAVLARIHAPEIGKLRVQAVLVFLFFGFAISAWIPHRMYGANILTLEELAPNFLAYFLGIVYFRTPARLRLLRAVLVAVALFILVNSLLELPLAHAGKISTPYILAHTDSLNVTQFRIRGLGMLADPNTYGQYILLILPLLFVAKDDQGLGLLGWSGALLLTIVSAIAIYLTGSRGALLGFVAILGLYLVPRLGTKGAVIATTLGGILLLGVNAYSTRTISMSGGMDRLAIWSDGLSYFKQSPIWGIGPREFSNRFGATAHNSYLLVAAELGIIGYFLWVSMNLVTLIQLGRLSKLKDIDGGLRRWALGLRISLGGYLFTSFFLSRAYELPLYMLLGMCGGVIVAAGGDEAVPLHRTLWPVWSMVLCIGILAVIYLALRLRAL